jgi:hypothetical protein
MANDQWRRRFRGAAPPWPPALKGQRRSAVVGANKNPAETWNLETALAVLKSVRLDPPNG